MASRLIDLKTTEAIIAAFVRKTGDRHALSKFVKGKQFSLATLSHNIHGRRHQIHVLQEVANFLGCGVYGVMPEVGARDERKVVNAQ